ncbi:hypothetical protein NKH77_23175 [Streptomyces sp. M19]
MLRAQTPPPGAPPLPPAPQMPRRPRRCRPSRRRRRTAAARRPGGAVPDAEATQFIPPFPGAGSAGGASPLPPENLPPGAQRESEAESTTMLRPVRAGRRAHGSPSPRPGTRAARRRGPATAVAAVRPRTPPRRPRCCRARSRPPVRPAGGRAAAARAPPGAPYAIRPGRPEDRRPPAEFDGLFRADGGQAGAQAGAQAGVQGADSTQQLPAFQEPGPPPAQRMPGGQGPYGPDGPGDVRADRPRRGPRAAW